MASIGKAAAAGLAACALWTAPALAQLASHPSGEPGPHGREDRRGIYLGLAGDFGAQFATGLDARLSYGGEVKLGYAINRSIQLYLAGSVLNATYDLFSQQLILATAHLHQFLFLDRSGLGVFYDAGVGVGAVSPGFGPLGNTGLGLGYSGGLGVEIPLARSFSLVPELYYRAVSASSEGGASGTVSAVGLQLGVVYY